MLSHSNKSVECSQIIFNHFLIQLRISPKRSVCVGFKLGQSSRGYQLIHIVLLHFFNCLKSLRLSYNHLDFFSLLFYLSVVFNLTLLKNLVNQLLFVAFLSLDLSGGNQFQVFLQFLLDFVRIPGRRTYQVSNKILVENLSRLKFKSLSCVNLL